MQPILLIIMASLAAASCPPLGPVLPPPRHPSRHPLVHHAASALADSMRHDYASRFNTSAISIGVQSAHEDEPLLDVHHTPPRLSGIGTDKVDRGTIYRVASVSKVVTALLALQESERVDWHASVLKYIPELANNAKGGIHRAYWAEVTVGSLASHLSGLATDINTDLALVPDGPWQDLGLPPIKNGSGPSCSGYIGIRPCTEDDLLSVINDRPPVFPPFQGASYSNIAFSLLGIVVERVTGLTFSELVQRNIFDPVGMDASFFDGPSDFFAENGFVALGETIWNASLGVYEAPGGMYTSTKNLLALGSAILSHEILPLAQTRAWLKPATNTGTLRHQVGAPWEIIRVDNLTSDGRLIDLYAKAGDLGLYVAEFVLVPDYDLVISVIAAGVEAVASGLETYTALSRILEELLPAIDNAARAKASCYTGRYADESTNSTIRVGLDEDPGLVLEQVIIRGVDVLANIRSYSLVALFASDEDATGAQQAPYLDARLYPTDITAHHGDEVSWRAVFGKISPQLQQQVDEMLAWPGFGCQTWLGLDRQSYNYQSLGEFIFVLEGGRVKGVRNAAFGVYLEKVSEERS